MGLRFVGVVVAGALALGTTNASALVLCGKGKGGVVKEGSPLKVRSACTGKEVAIEPDAVGLRGPAGAPGSDGAPGADGPMGAPGLSGHEIVEANGNAIISGTGVSTGTASCPPGKRVLGGGAELFAISFWVTKPTIEYSRPVTSDPQGWTASTSTGQNNDDWWVRVWAICATVSP